MKRLTLGLFLAVSIFFLAAKAEAQPQGRFAVAWIQNNLTGPVTIYYRWVWPNGNVAADWKSTQIQPGRMNYFSWRYNGNVASSPHLYVRFDTDRNAGALYWEYRLARGQSPDNQDGNFGTIYRINYVNNRREFAELYNGNNLANAELLDRFSSVP